MQMLQSRTLVEGALRDAGLYELPSIVENMSPIQQPYDVVIGGLAVTRGGTGQARTAHVLNVTYKNPSPVDSEIVLSAIIKKYQQFLSEKFQDVNQEAADVIYDAQRELALDLKTAEDAYEQFRQQSSNLMWKNGDTTNIHRVRYEGVLQEIATLQLLRADAAARLDAVQDRLGDKNADELTDLEKLSLVDEKNLARVGLLLMAQRGETESPNFQAEQPLRVANARVELENYSALQIREKSLLTDLGAQHPEVVNVRKQMESLEDFMDRKKQDLKSGQSSFSLNPKTLFEAYHQLLKNDIVAMDRREERLRLLADESVKLASEMVTDEIQGETLKKDVDRKQALFDAAVDRLRDINLTKDYGGFINEVLSAPERGLQVMPRMRYSLPLGMLLFMGIAVTGIAVAEYRDRRFRSIYDLRNILQLPVIGKIPQIVDESSKSSSLFRRKTNSEFALNRQLVSPDSRGADAFRLLRTSLVFGDGDEHRQVLCVTSPNPGDGKSTMTGNLSVSLGQLGRRVLIIDCDLRRPSQHELFGMENDRGLTTILSEKLDPSDLIKATPHNNVYVLPRGESVENPAEFLATGEFAQLIDSLREKYDHIFLDCPPVLPVVDVLAIASLADGVLVVIRVERTTQLQAQAACSALKQAGASLTGVVVNGLTADSLSNESYGYGYGYGYSYDGSGYGYSEYSEYNTKSPSREAASPRKAAAYNRNGSSNGSGHE
jgi:capsular exopolysaccharide synthesis family protein